jgi:hypothetical protein
MDTNQIELATVAVNDDGGRSLVEQNFAPSEISPRPIPPADGGKDAWLFLVGCFFVEALVWGFPFSFGIFQQYYTEHEPFSGSSSIAVIGTCSMVCNHFIRALRVKPIDNDVGNNVPRCPHSSHGTAEMATSETALLRRWIVHHVHSFGCQFFCADGDASCSDTGDHVCNWGKYGVLPGNSLCK